MVERQLNLSIKPELIVQDFNNYYTNNNKVIIIIIKAIKKNSEVEYFINGFSSKSLFFKDFLLPYKLEKSDLIIPFPYDYLVLYYLIFVELNKEKNSFDSQIKDFPKCIMHISYQNLEGTNYEKIFDLEIDYQGGTTLLNPEKITQFNLTIKSKIY